MPKYGVSLLVISVVLWIVLFIFAANTSALFFWNKILFLIILFFTLGITLLSILNIALNFFQKSADLFMRLKRSFKYGFFLSFVITGIFAMRGFSVANKVNVGLFLILCLTIYTQLKDFRKVKN